MTRHAIRKLFYVATLLAAMGLGSCGGDDGDKSEAKDASSGDAVVDGADLTEGEPDSAPELEPLPAPKCGDDECNGDETCSSCGQDCGDCFECACDRDEKACNVKGPGSYGQCECDPDCEGVDKVCQADGACDTWCLKNDDPDCLECDCDFHLKVCEVEEKNSSAACACDVECIDGQSPCSKDDHCDSWCPKGEDPDCEECKCDYNDDVCEASSDGTTDKCDCDVDCSGSGSMACTQDGHCDTWCDPGGECKDPDCNPGGWECEW